MGFEDLISVSYVDNTNSVIPDPGEDVLGIVINHHWGPVNELLTLDRETFTRLYPNSLPIGNVKTDVRNYFAYASVLKAFDSGISKVEVVRFNDFGKSDKWSYKQGSLILNSERLLKITEFEDSDSFLSEVTESEYDKLLMTICFKYPGIPPKSLVQGNDIEIKAKLNREDYSVKLTILSVQDDTRKILEEFEGGFVKDQIVEGKNFFIENVVKESNFIAVKANLENVRAAFTGGASQEALTLLDFNNSETTIETPSFLETESEAIISTYLKYFSDIEMSNSTMIMPAVSDDNALISNALISIAEKCKERMAVLGYPTTKDLTKTDILSYYQLLNSSRHAVFIAGRENISVLGSQISSNCVSGWCGRTANVATSVRINQLASAKTYGKYSGVLTQSLSFDDVLELHDTKGIISVYNSVQGPTIFGVRTMNAKQNSYFAKANVMRVTSAILKQLFPLCIDVLHTDVAANPIQRSAFEITLNSIIQRFVANQDLKQESNAVCDGQLNNDIDTAGGEMLIIELNLWFIKLTEKIAIRIIATDSSVTAQIQ